MHIKLLMHIYPKMVNDVPKSLTLIFSKILFQLSQVYIFVELQIYGDVS